MILAFVVVELNIKNVVGGLNMFNNNRSNNKNNQKKDDSKFYITIIICLIILFFAGMSFQDSRYMSLKSLYDLESGKNYELQKRIDELELQLDQQNVNLSLQLAKEQGKRESLILAYDHVVEESRKQSQWIEEFSQNYFEMRQAMQDAQFQVQLCRYGVSSWEEYVTKLYGENYLENNP